MTTSIEKKIMKQKELFIQYAAKLKKQIEQYTAEIEKLKQQIEQYTAEIEELKQPINDPEHPLQKFVDQVIPVFAQMIDIRLGITFGGGESVSHTAKNIAIQLNLSESEISDIEHAARLHNIGLIGLHDDVITTPYNEQTKAQKKELDTSPLKGEAILISMPPLKNIAHIIRHQYERYDGKGYPDEIFGKHIPIGSRILAVAVDFDELQNGIFFGEKLNFMQAYEYIMSRKGKNYDPEVIEAFTAVFSTNTYQSLSTVRELSLKSSDIEVGMKLTQNLKLNDGMLLLGAGQELTEVLIDKLRLLESRLGKRFVFHVAHGLETTYAREEEFADDEVA
jgi:response regulator RpfG family c-di-GMP phosphodiesterase